MVQNDGHTYRHQKRRIYLTLTYTLQQSASHRNMAECIIKSGRVHHHTETWQGASRNHCPRSFIFQSIKPMTPPPTKKTICIWFGIIYLTTGTAQTQPITKRKCLTALLLENIKQPSHTRNSLWPW